MNIPLISYMTSVNFGFEVVNGTGNEKVDGMFPLTCVEREIDRNDVTNEKIALMCNHYFQCYRDYIHPDRKIKCEPVRIRISLWKPEEADLHCHAFFYIEGFETYDPKYIEWKRHASGKCFANMEKFNYKTTINRKITLRELDVLTSLIFKFHVYKRGVSKSIVEQKGLMPLRVIRKEIDVEHLTLYQIAEIFDHIFQSFKGYIHPHTAERYEPVSIHVRWMNDECDVLPRNLDLYLYGLTTVRVWTLPVEKQQDSGIHQKYLTC